MKSIKQILALILCVSLFVPMAQATPGLNQQQEPQRAKVSEEDLTILIQQEQVRFTSRKAVAEMQLQVFDQTGQLVFDSGVMTQQELAWAFRHVNGDAVKSGLYAYTLTIKEADAETARVRRGHFIVDRANERDNRSDRLWVTSQNDSNIAADLTVARNEGAVIAGAVIPRERNIERDSVNDVEAQLKAESAAALTPSASATAGRIAKFITSNSLGNSVMTELNGNIGVGITSPLSKLHILSSASEVLPPRAQSSSSTSFSAGWDFYHGTTGKGYVGVPGTATGIAPGEMLLFGSVNTPTSIWAGGVRGITVNPSGNVGIGTTNTNAPYRLQVLDEQPTAEIGGAVIGLSVHNAGVLGQTDDGVGVLGWANSGFAGRFVGKVGFEGDAFPTADGYRLGTPARRWTAVYAVNGTIQTSDARLKKGITNLHYGLNELMQLRPVSFQWKDDNNGQQHLGFIAQETQEVIPEAVVQTEDPSSPLGMNYTTLIPVVIKAVQEQQSVMTTLKAENESLQAQNTTLQQQNTNLDLRLKSLEKTVQQLTLQKSKRKAVRR
ncbi:MAG: tail fiber domain-containing protein [Acidobacteria bacterium]|nr:tail fiber domain-containing protein [Acidobacteriota bacterium]